MDILHASLMNGISSHVFDFDDTHLKTVIHPAAPVVPAILALSEQRAVSGKAFLNALVLGVEVECRIGNAVYPAHYDRGWHITGTAGVFGSAAASGKLLGLSEQQMVWALGLAATQPVGLREMFGSMTKSFHPGRSAQNGLTAAHLAAHNFTSAPAGIEGKSGWANVLSTSQDYGEITEQHGKTYEILLNTYKPFACGIVIHPTIDACIQLRQEHKLTADQIAAHRFDSAPAGAGAHGKEDAADRSREQVQRLLRGGAGDRPRIRRGAGLQRPERARPGHRGLARSRHGGRRSRDQGRTGARGRDHEGRPHVRQVRGARQGQPGAADDRSDLEAKFMGLTDRVLPPDRARRLMELCWNVETLSNVGELARVAARENRP